jgi:hypothetical protein
MREYNTFSCTGSTTGSDNYSITICDLVAFYVRIPTGVNDDCWLDGLQHLGSCRRRQTLIEGKDGVASVPRRFQPVYKRITQG